MPEFQHLFSPIKIGGLTLRNRIYSTGHVPAFAEGGYPLERYRLYCAEKARGGAGLVIFGGSTSVSASSPATEWSMVANRDDRIIPYYRQMADAVHAHGAGVMTQLTHMGRRGQSDSEQWLPLVAPSQIPEPYHQEIPHEIEEEQIRQIVREFGQAVRRCREGGLDGAELSAAHNHLIDQFWSPRTNQRTDRWGGSLENRMRFSLEVLEEIRRVAGRDYVVGMRISGDEHLQGGLGPEEMKEIARRLAATGLVDFFSILGGSAENYVNLAAVVPNMMFPSQPYVYLAAAIKEAVVVATGGRPYRPDLPGFDAPEVVTSWEILTGAVKAGNNVLIIDDDGRETAPGVADYLAERGRRVEIATTLRRVGEHLGDSTFPVVYQRLYGAGVVMTPNVRPLAFEGGSVILQNIYALGEETREKVDTVVLAMRNRSVDTLSRTLKGRVAVLHLIGDAMAPRGIHNAILEGTYAGRKV